MRTIYVTRYEFEYSDKIVPKNTLLKLIHYNHKCGRYWFEIQIEELKSHQRAGIYMTKDNFIEYRIIPLGMLSLN